MAPLPNNADEESCTSLSLVFTKEGGLENELKKIAKDVDRTADNDDDNISTTSSLSLGNDSLPDGDLDAENPSGGGDVAITNLTAAFNDSWGEQGFIAELPSTLRKNNRASSLPNFPLGGLGGGNKKKKKKKKLSFGGWKRNINRRASGEMNVDYGVDDDCSVGSQVSFTSAVSCASSVSDYQGPRPLGKDGKPLKSAMKKSSTPSTNVDDEELSLSDFDDDESGSKASKGSKTSKSSSKASKGVSFGGGSSVGFSVDSSKDEKKKKPSRRLSFSSVEIRDYNREVGDNPSVSGGAPLALGWNYNKTAEIDLEEYEKFKDEHCGGGRSRSEIIVPSHVRSKILRYHGVSNNEIRTATKEANVTRSERQKTMAQQITCQQNKATGKMLGQITREEAAFELREKMRKATGRARRRESNEERELDELWENAHQAAVEKYLQGDTSAVAPDNHVSEDEVIANTTISIPVAPS